MYSERADHIPLVRRKVASIRRRSGLDPNGFDGKILAQVLASYPRDELFQCSEDELFTNAMAITQIHERRRTRVFLRRDRYGLFYTCLVFMPRDVYNTRLRVRIQELLKATLGAEDAPFDAYFSESILVRLQFVIRVPIGNETDAEPVDIDDLQRSIIALTRDWSQDLRQALVHEHGEAEGRRLIEEYLDAIAGRIPGESFARRGRGRHRGHGAAERAAQSDDATLPRPERSRRHVFPARFSPR